MGPLVRLEPIALRLDEERLMKQGESLHRARVVWSHRRKAMRHLQKFGICGFKIADRFPAELLVADPGYVRNEPVACFGRNLRQRTEGVGFEERRRLRGQ
jgi:hypothetical protein